MSTEREYLTIDRYEVMVTWSDGHQEWIDTPENDKQLESYFDALEEERNNTLDIYNGDDDG
jgi:hypothetical protein